MQQRKEKERKKRWLKFRFLHLCLESTLLGKENEIIRKENKTKKNRVALEQEYCETPTELGKGDVENPRTFLQGISPFHHRPKRTHRDLKQPDR